MDVVFQVIKMLLVSFYTFGGLFADAPAGGDFAPSEPVEPGNEAQYLQIEAEDEGFDTWNPVQEHGGYRYGPSMILNADGSLDVWSPPTAPAISWTS